MPSVFIFLTAVWTPQCGDYRERVTQAANLIISLFSKHPHYSLPRSSHGMKYWHLNNVLAGCCVPGVLTHRSLLKVNTGQGQQGWLLLQFNALLEEVFICQALGLKSSPSDAPHPP